MQNSKDIQELIYRTIENISKELINKTNYLYLVEGKVTEIDTLGNCYVFKYQDEDYVGFSITGEKYNVGDLIYVLFSNNKDVKKMILSKTKAFSNNDIRRLVNRAQDSANEAKENAQEALDRIQEIGKDGNISPNEKLIIKKDWENIKIEYTQVTEEMELYGGSKNQILKPLKEQYDNNYIALKSYIEPILEDLTSSSKIDSNEFLEKFNNYYTIRQEIAQAIADITKTIADETQELAKINKQLLSDIANDDKLTSSEKQSVLKEFQSIVAEYAIIIEQARYYGLIYTDYDNSYNELSEYLSPLLENLNSTSDITGIIFRQYFINYYTERQKLQKRISDTAKDIANEAENIANEALQNTKLLSIEADGQIFSKTSNSEDFYPNYISLSVKTNVVTFDKFQYKTSNSDWQDVVTEEHGFTILGESLTISKDSDLFTNSNNNITIQALSSDSSIKDIFTIIKVQDGVIGENALSVILTNEAHVFPAGVSAALNSSTETEILAFDGASPVEVEVVGISTLPSGLTAQISNNKTLKPKITFTATTLLTEVKDVIITLKVKNTEIQKYFSYTLGLKGEPGDPGENAWSIVLGNDSQNIPCNSDGITNTTLTVDIPVYTFYGTLMMASTLSVGTLPSGVAATSITNGTASAPGNVQLTFSTNINLGGKDSGTIDINVVASNKDFIKKFSWSKTKQGEDGISGADGNGISSITEYYQVSTSNSTAPTSWIQTVPTLTATNKYLWNYEKITYTNGSSFETKKRVIGVYGDKGATGSTGPQGEPGDTGNGISSITNYYLASASSSGVTTSTSGWTTTIQSATSSKKYLWNYEEIIYTNGQSISTTPCIIGTYGDKGDSGRIYFLELSSLVIKKGSDNVLNPSTITFQSYYRDGTSATRTAYSGRFIIQESIDGNSYTTKYTSSANESSKTYTPSSSNIKSIKCILCAAGGTTTQLDSQTVTVLSDIDGLEIGGRNLLKNSSGNLKNISNWEGIYSSNAESNGDYYLHVQKDLTEATHRASVANLSFPKEDISKYEYSISGYYRNNGDIDISCQIWIRGNSEGNIYAASKNVKIPADGEWHYITSTGKGNGVPDYDFLRFEIAISQGKVVNLDIKKVKVEHGNTPTDWTPAPEDIQEDIHNSKQEAIEASRTYVDVKEKEINSNVENIKTVVDGHTTAISTVQSSVQQTENKVNTVFTQTEEIKNLTDQNATQLQQYKQYISMEPVKHEGETEARPTITLGQSTSSFKVAIDNKEIAFTGASGEKVAYITGDELRINNVVVVRKLAIGDFFLEQEENGHLVLKKGR